MILCNLKKLIREYDVTQTQIIEATGITRPTLLQLIKNENNGFKYDTLEKLCRFFNVDLNEILQYSPVEIEFKEILFDLIPLQIDWGVGVTNSEGYILSFKYVIDGIDIEFDTNLMVSEKASTMHQYKNKLTLNALIPKLQFEQLELHNFDINFLYTFNEYIDLEKKIYEALKSRGLFTDFEIKDFFISTSALSDAPVTDIFETIDKLPDELSGLKKELTEKVINALNNHKED